MVEKTLLCLVCNRDIVLSAFSRVIRHKARNGEVKEGICYACDLDLIQIPYQYYFENRGDKRSTEERNISIFNKIQNKI